MLPPAGSMDEPVEGPARWLDNPLLKGKNVKLPRRLPPALDVVQARVRPVVSGDCPSTRHRPRDHKALVETRGASLLSALKALQDLADSLGLGYVHIQRGLRASEGLTAAIVAPSASAIS